MNLLKLSKYLAGELINKKVIEIPNFIDLIENNLKIDNISDFKNNYDGFTNVNDYYKILNYIFEKGGKESILFILNKFGLKENFIQYVDLGIIEKINLNDLSNIKKNFLKEFDKELNELNKSENNKENGNKYEELVEKFLLNSSFFNKGFTKEFKFENGGQKIDRLLRLNKNILNINNSFLGYVIVEMKFKKKKSNGGEGTDVSVNEIPQFESYIKILAKNKISKYGILVCNNDFKKTAVDKIKAILENENSNEQSFYIGLITSDEIKKFLENKGNYENMTFDEFIERSFIKWLK